MAFCRPQPGPVAGGEVLGRSPELGHALLCGIVPQYIPARAERVAVIEQEGRARGQPRNQPVPHHPAAGRVIEQAVALPEIGMQAVLLDVLQQGPAGAVNDRFGHARGPGGIQDEQRVGKRQARELDALNIPVIGDKIRERDAVLHG